MKELRHKLWRLGDKIFTKAEVARLAGVTEYELRKHTVISGELPQPSAERKGYKKKFYTEAEMKEIAAFFKARCRGADRLAPI